MEIVIVGLGLIGGSLAEALKQNTSHRVLGMDVNDDVLLDACSCGAIDGKAALSDLERADVVYLCLYPEDILDFVRSYGSRLKPGCVLTDACGIKQEICAAMEELSQNAPYQFVAGHPMAGKEQSGFAASDPSIFIGASYILVPGKASPQAVAVVDPHRRDCGYPFPCLAGVGVALKLALALTPGSERERVLSEYADLAAIGTVADVMQLSGENRAIVRRGLQALARTRRPGLRALIREAGAEGKSLTASCIGFTLAPRINAAGRMGCAPVAAELLLTEDPGRAEALSHALCALNRERQSIEGRIYEECLARLERESAGQRRSIVLAGEGWHQGVVGIVASRLAEKYACPTFMICVQDGRGKGSCRSFGGFNLFRALESCADLLEGFGGHALAAGFTILEEHIGAFRQRIDRCVEEWTGEHELASALEVDAELPDENLLTVEEVAGLDLLEPYGAGNPKPVFSLSGCTVSSLAEVGGGRHLKLRLSRGGHLLDAIFFSVGAAETGVAPGDRIDVTFTPQINEFRGNRSVQLQLCDLRPAPTRMAAEQALYERLRRGEALSAQEAAALIPSRAEFTAVWRYLSGHARLGRVEDTARRLARGVSRTYGIKETVMRTMVCLEVLDEHGLIQVEQTLSLIHI